MTTFEVDNVKLSKGEYPDEPAIMIKAWEKRLSKPGIMATSNPKLKIVSTGSCGFFEACRIAYDQHYRLEIGPEMFHLIITQALALHIKENSEKYRDRIVTHEGRENIEIVKNKSWGKVLGDFASVLKTHVKDEQLVGKITTRFTTSTNTSITAANIALLDVFHNYYGYSVSTLCGIPEITVNGTEGDWEKILAYLEYLNNYDLDWYTVKVVPIIKKIIETIKGIPNLNFWRSMVREEDVGSGDPEFRGWIINLYPYINSGTEGSYVVNKNDYLTSFCLPSGLSRVPFVWNYLGEARDMNFYCGFVGIECRNRTLKASIQWAVTK